jgi:hypothetical protein
VNLALAFTWTGTGVLFGFEISALPKPERTQLRTSDWIDLGQSRWLQGLRIIANTFNTERTIDVEYDGWPLTGGHFTLTMLHDGEVMIPYAFEPVICHRIRLTPLDAGTDTWEVFGAEPVGPLAPESVTIWKPEATSHGMRGYQHVRELRPKILGVAGTNCTISATCEFGSFTLTVPMTGQIQKLYFAAPPNKGQLYQWEITAPEVRVWAEDFEIYCKSWGDTGPYTVVQPFGEVETKGARI